MMLSLLMIMMLVLVMVMVMLVVLRARIGITMRMMIIKTGPGVRVGVTGIRQWMRMEGMVKTTQVVDFAEDDACEASWKYPSDTSVWGFSRSLSADCASPFLKHHISSEHRVLSTTTFEACCEHVTSCSLTESSPPLRDLSSRHGHTTALVFLGLIFH